jgi:hypothetical protein
MITDHATHSQSFLLHQQTVNVVVVDEKDQRTANPVAKRKFYNQWLEGYSSTFVQLTRKPTALTGAHVSNSTTQAIYVIRRLMFITEMTRRTT